MAYISNNSFIDGLIHRQMRKKLMETFDKIYILDLHGNSKKKETAPDNGKDENVFDIMQGVSINIFVKKNKGIREGIDTQHIATKGTKQNKGLDCQTYNKSLFTKAPLVAGNDTQIPPYSLIFHFDLYGRRQEKYKFSVGK